MTFSELTYHFLLNLIINAYYIEKRVTYFFCLEVISKVFVAPTLDISGHHVMGSLTLWAFSHF